MFPHRGVACQPFVDRTRSASIGGTMKIMIRLMAIIAALFVSQLCMAQAPAGAPAGSTALCNDGSYFNGATKSGACRGHKGIKTWFGPASAVPAKTTTAKTASGPAPTPAPAPAAKPAAAEAPAPASATKTASTKAASTPTTPAPGGGPGLVWVNTASNVYHCPGTRYYGTTKAGAYMTEDQAKAKGARADAGKPCTK